MSAFCHWSTVDTSTGEINFLQLHCGFCGNEMISGLSHFGDHGYYCNDCDVSEVYDNFEGLKETRPLKADVYRNLQRDCFSVRSRETENYGEVIDHATVVFISPAEFVVQPKGRERVLEERRKNVHAFIRGRVTMNARYPDIKMSAIPMKQITYHPYERGEFYCLSNNKGIDEADWALVTMEGVFVSEDEV